MAHDVNVAIYQDGHDKEFSMMKWKNWISGLMTREVRSS